MPDVILVVNKGANIGSFAREISIPFRHDFQNTKEWGSDIRIEWKPWQINIASVLFAEDSFHLIDFSQVR